MSSLLFLLAFAFSIYTAAMVKREKAESRVRVRNKERRPAILHRKP